MNTAIHDRRVRKTKSQIRRSLTVLLKTKELSDISVCELTKLSDISRGTFYLHYKNVFDLFEQTESELADDVCAIITSQRGKALWPSSPAMLDLFRFIADNADIFDALLRVRETEFLNKITAKLKPQGMEEWLELMPGADERMFEYCYAFIASGSMSVLKLWFAMGMPETAELISGFTTQITQGLLALMERAQQGAQPK